MKKIIEIRGMQCEHCKAKVLKALNSIEGVEAKVDLKKKNASVSCSEDIEDKIIENIINEIGFQVVSIKEKKGLFNK